MIRYDTHDKQIEDFWDRVDQLAVDTAYTTFDLGWAVFRHPRVGGCVSHDQNGALTLVLDQPWVEAMVAAGREDVVFDVVRQAFAAVRGGWWVDRPIPIPPAYRAMRRDWLARS